MAPVPESIPQFFISLINTSDVALTLASYCASAHCGWINEPMLDEIIAPNDERVWCGMPREISIPIEIELSLQAASGEYIDLRFDHHDPAPANGSLLLRGGGGHLRGEAELRSKASSPFLMVTISVADGA